MVKNLHPRPGCGDEQAPAFPRRVFVRVRVLPKPLPRTSPTKKGGGAPKGASIQWPRRRSERCRPNVRGARLRAIADKRAQSARLICFGARSPSGAPPRYSPSSQAWLSSGPALHGIGMCEHPSPRAASSSRAGRSASRAGSRSRPGTVCETARGLPRSLRSSDRIRKAPFGERAASPSTDRQGTVKLCHHRGDNRLIQ
jgi:hypothetical protein